MSPLSNCYIAFLALTFFVQGAVAQYPDGKTFKPGYCNICRDVPNGNGWRNLVNPGETIDMDGETWTCGYLQETVQDVNPYNGAPGEGRMCAIAQTFAEKHCTCDGPEIPSMDDNVKDLNPACDLCQGQAMNYVPSVNSGMTANTGVAGNMNCMGLYNAMAEGVLTSNLCPIVQKNAGPVCCSLEPIQIGNPGTPPSLPAPAPVPPPEPVCVSAAEKCDTNKDCCPGLECKIKVWNGPKYCSSRNNRPRQSIASGYGGAAARSRAGN